MNYLSHHHVARLAAGDTASPLFYIGNILPDLLAVEGSGGRLRLPHLAASTERELARGAALHLATDRNFHAAPAFADAVADASALLRSAPFQTAPRRVFFLAHVFVELALDAALLRADSRLVDHFYAPFTPAVSSRVVAATEAMLSRPLPALPEVLSRFVRSRYLYHYAEDGGLAEALHRISLRAGLTGFATPPDRTRLAEAFAAFLPRAAALGPLLWMPPKPWYNEGAPAPPGEAFDDGGV